MSPPRKRGSTSAHKKVDSRFRGNDTHGVILESAEMGKERNLALPFIVGCARSTGFVGRDPKSAPWLVTGPLPLLAEHVTRETRSSDTCHRTPDVERIAEVCPARCVLLRCDVVRAAANAEVDVGRIALVTSHRQATGERRECGPRSSQGLRQSKGCEDSRKHANDHRGDSNHSHIRRRQAWVGEGRDHRRRPQQ